MIGLNKRIILVGIALVLSALPLILYTETVVHPVLGIVVQRTYPFRQFGMAIALIGIVTIVIGIIVETKFSVSSEIQVEGETRK